MGNLATEITKVTIEESGLSPHLAIASEKHRRMNGFSRYFANSKVDYEQIDLSKKSIAVLLAANSRLFFQHGDRMKCQMNRCTHSN